ncbi:hypothetical protein [Frisingicoccus sp.]|uniref:hypothetical protein n=1 Tax=Frisingicoccus sp. TaxID=1918627 RepID=UPI002EB37E05|nr:hypothetical protein [Frisingicoccus sp.]
MKIEVLFPEYCNLFADSSNMKYLQQCLPEAEFIYTDYMSEPVFVTETVNLIYMGAMTEHMQSMVIKKLMPYKERIVELIKQDVPFLITSNALEIFGRWIENEDGTKEKALGIFDFYAKRDMMHRFNGLVRGHFGDMPIIGFKTQFSMAYSQEFKYPFIQIDRGTGMNPKVNVEGIHLNHFYGTYLVGPFLVLNPLFTKYLMKVMGVEQPVLAHEAVIMDAYERRMKEFMDPKVEF